MWLRSFQISWLSLFPAKNCSGTILTLPPQISECLVKVQLQTCKAVQSITRWIIWRGASAVIQLPTGTGKSLVLLHIAAQSLRQRKRVYLVAPTEEWRNG